MNKVQQNGIYGIFCLLLSFLVVLNVLYFWPVDILQEWKITVPKKTYHAAEEVHLTSTYTKTRNITGESHRYLVCNGTKYAINVVRKPAQAGKKSTHVDLIIPESTAKPATCSISIEILYELPGGRKVIEKNHTNEFRLE
jgi:hypothetical protein